MGLTSVQSGRHPSKRLALPSSQCSPASTWPSPQEGPAADPPEADPALPLCPAAAPEPAPVLEAGPGLGEDAYSASDEEEIAARREARGCQE